MAITATLWTVAVLYCAGCDRDLARVTAREDHHDALNGTIGTLVIGHMRTNGRGHRPTCRSVEELTWDQLQAPGGAGSGGE